MEGLRDAIRVRGWPRGSDDSAASQAEAAEQEEEAEVRAGNPVQALSQWIRESLRGGGDRHRRGDPMWG